MVCDNGWDEIDATVVCTQLGFGQPGELEARYSYTIYLLLEILADLSIWW